MNIERNALIASQIAQGVPLHEIGNQLGCTKQNISLISKSSIVKELIERARENIVIQGLDKALSNFIAFLHSDNPEDKGYKFKASERILESIGVLSSHTQAPLVLNIYQQNNEIHLDQAASTAMNHLGINKVDAIDVES